MDLATLFDPRSLQRGRALQRDGAVLSWHYEDDEDALYASVQGTAAQPYEVEIWFDDGDIAEAACSCPVEIDCKHAAAAMLDYLASTESSRPAAAAPGGTPYRGGGRAAPAAVDADAVATRRFEDWLARFSEAAGAVEHGRHGAGVVGRRPPDRERVYTLEPRPSPTDVDGTLARGVLLRLLDAQRTRAGGLAKGRRYTPHQVGSNGDTRVTPADEEIAGLCRAAFLRHDGRYYRDDGVYALDGRLGHSILDLVMDSARCFIGTDRRRPLSRGPTRALELTWTATRDGQRLSASLDGLERAWVAPTDPPMWIDPATATCGPIASDLNAAALSVALEAPTVPERHLEAMAYKLENLRTAGTGPKLGSRPDAADSRRPLLPAPPVERVPLIEGEPAPVLFLCSPDEDPHVDAWRVLLFMRYGTALLPCEIGEGERITRTTDTEGRELRVLRDRGAEIRRFFDFIERCPGLLPEVDGDRSVRSTFIANGSDPAARFARYRQLVRQREALERDGWTLMLLPPVHTETVRPSRFDGFVQRTEDDGPGWFDVSLGFEIDGVHHDLMPLVATYIERGGGDDPLLVEQGDGRFVEVPVAVLRPVARVFEELGMPAERTGTIRLSRARALALDGLQGELGEAGIDTDWRGEREPFELARRLRAFVDARFSGGGGADAALGTVAPRGLRATLRPYQLVGLGWLNLLAKHELCGVLADDMGLGKTLQTLAHILWLRQSRRLAGPALIVAPTSLLENWAREAERFAPRLRARVWHGLDRHERPLAHDVDLVITSYGLVLRDRELLADHGFELLVLDEAQQIRNAQAKTTRAIKSLPIERRLCLSGTPLENHLGELWSQFDFLMPGLLGDARRFSRHFRTPIERHGDTERQQRLAAAIAPFLLRRRKEAVAADLPPKSDILREVRFGDAQAKLYESIRVAMQQRVRDALAQRGLAQSKVTVLDALLKLRQLCCHPELVKLPSAKAARESAKTALALDMIDELVAEGRRILLFSSFTSMLAILERELAVRGHRWVKLTGQTRKRDTVIDAFQRGDVPLFLISLKAGGVGLNLTAADTVIHYDPWWNPAAEEQASARAHRIGQDKPVFVYRLVTADTVEQRIVTMQQRKRDLADAMIEGGDAGALAALSAEETLALFDG